MENSRTRAQKTRTLVGVALFTAIVVVLQLLGSFIKFGPFSISLVLIPIVVGAAVYGAWAGAWLGFVFSVVVLITDAGAFLAVSVIGTVVTVILKGTLAGLLAGLVYKALANKNQYLAVLVAAFVCPVVNTGIFLLGCLVFFMPTISGWAESMGFPSAGNYMIYGMVGINFLAELVTNLVFSPLIVRIIKLGQKE
ncbi:MAG: ECF transporter S component [Oscillospiraceae bacterium]|nr:ECF transporter S component [Oscillospiraceae bacterium]